jgi:hypothetical protein
MSAADDISAWTCAACGGPLEIAKVQFEYMKGTFEVDLPACPACDLVLVSEELATGKIADAERTLEDK